MIGRDNAVEIVIDFPDRRTAEAAVDGQCDRGNLPFSDFQKTNGRRANEQRGASGAAWRFLSPALERRDGVRQSAGARGGAVCARSGRGAVVVQAVDASRARAARMRFMVCPPRTILSGEGWRVRRRGVNANRLSPLACADSEDTKSGCGGTSVLIAAVRPSHDGVGPWPRAGWVSATCSRFGPAHPKARR